MTTRDELDPTQQPSTHLTRRQIVASSGMLVTGLLLSACGGSRMGLAGAGSYQTGGAQDPDADDVYHAPMLPSTGASGGTTPSSVWPPAQTTYTPPTYSPPPTYTPPPTNPVPASTQIMARASWTRMGVARPREIYALGSVRKITIHHDGMPLTSLRTSGDVAARIEQIRAAHVNGRGWADIGYHYVIDPAGRVWEGRHVSYQGAHIKDQNENNLGILVLGNFEQQWPTKQALGTLDRFVFWQMQRYNIQLSQVRTHRERAKTSCPGKNLQGYLLASRGRGGAIAINAARAGLARG